MEDAATPAPSERGWGKLLLALAAFLLIPPYTPLRALLPVEDTLLLLMPDIPAPRHPPVVERARLLSSSRPLHAAAGLLSAR